MMFIFPGAYVDLCTDHLLVVSPLRQLRLEFCLINALINRCENFINFYNTLGYFVQVYGIILYLYF